MAITSTKWAELSSEMSLISRENGRVLAADTFHENIAKAWQVQSL